MADAFPISGQIDPKGFPFLLLELHRQGATGSLKVDGPSYQKALYFRGGRVLFGSSNDPRDQLGAILIESGKITPEQLEDVNTKVGPGNPLAKVLADTGFVNQRELSEAARAKVERILSDVIAYTAGSFEFEDGVLPKGAIDLKLSTERLVLSAVRRVSDRNFVLRHLEGLDVVLVPTAQIAGVSTDVLAETGSLHEHLDGQRTLKEAAALTRMEEFEAAKIACGLIFLGMVQRIPQPPSGVLAAPEEAAFFDLPETGGNDLELASPPDPFGASEATIISPPEMSDPFAAPANEQPFGASEAAIDSPPEITDPFATPQAEPPAFFAPAPEIDFGAAAPTDTQAYRTQADPATPDSDPFDAEPPVPPEPQAETAILPASTLPWGVSADAAAGAEGHEAGQEPDLEPEAPAATASRPSKDDLAALDALLGSRTAEQGSSEPGPERWAPQFGSTGSSSGSSSKGRRGRRSSGPSRGLLIGGAAAAVIALAGAGAGWYFFLGPGVRHPPPPPTLSPAATTATTLAAAPSSPPSPQEVPVTTQPAAPALSAPVTVAPATTAPPAPSTTLARPATATPAPAERASGDLAGARHQMQQGQVQDAARAFAVSLKQAPAGSATVQLLVACSVETIQKAISNVSGDEMFILPIHYKGKECFRICWGVYPTSARAASAVHAIPEYFVKGGASPKVVSAAEVLR